MSRDHGKIKSSLWRSQKFRRLANNDRAKLQYCYFHTCPHGNSIGCYPIAPGYMMADLFWGEEQVAENIDFLVEVNLTEWNADEQIIRIIGFIERDPPTNIKHAAFMAKEALSLPDCAEKLHVIEDLLDQKFVADQESLSAERDRLLIAYAEPIGPLPSPSPSPLPLPDPNPSPTPERVAQEFEIPAFLRRKKKEPDRFEEFYAIYPLKRDKGHALKAWPKAVTMATPEQIIAAAKAYAAQRSGEDDKFTKYPATWLKGMCWLDHAKSLNGAGPSLEQLLASKAKAEQAGIRTDKLDKAIAEKRAAV
jgi:hypothetical protein